MANPFEAIDYQTEYVKDLLDATDYPRLDVHKSQSCSRRGEHHKTETILGYRDYGYPSTLTGTLAPKHHTRWMDAMDDSLAAFLNVPRAAE